MGITCLLLMAPTLGTLVEANRVSAVPLRMVPPSAEEVVDNKFHGFVELGGTYASGNTDIRSARLAAEAVKRNEKNRYTFKSYWNYTEDEDGITDRNAGLSAKWDRFLTEKLFVNALGGVETDSVAGVDLRWYVGGGVGYQFLDTEKTKLLGEAGLVYFHEELVGEIPNPAFPPTLPEMLEVEDDNSYLAARVSYDLDWQLTETTLFEQTAEAFPSLEDINDFYGKLDSKLSFKITGTLSAFIQHILNYDTTPAEDKERLDNRVVVGVRYTF